MYDMSHIRDTMLVNLFLLSAAWLCFPSVKDVGLRNDAGLAHTPFPRGPLL